MKQIIVFILLKIGEFGGAFGLLYLTYRIFAPLTYGKAPTPFLSVNGILFSIWVLVASVGVVMLLVVSGYGLFKLFESNWNLAKRLTKK